MWQLKHYFLQQALDIPLSRTVGMKNGHVSPEDEEDEVIDDEAPFIEGDQSEVWQRP